MGRDLSQGEQSADHCNGADVGLHHGLASVSGGEEAYIRDAEDRNDRTWPLTGYWFEV